jgi:tetratricopeptide (TPR) repeat protein
MEEAEETQLALSKPRIDSQLRVQAALNAPERIQLEQNNNDVYRNTIFSPLAMRAGNSTSSAGTGTVLPLSLASLEQQGVVKNMLKDYTTMAYSNNRSGRKDIEAFAYSCLGIIHDNLGNLKLAINSYQQYLQLAAEVGDVHAQMKALNFLGVDHYLVARKLKDEAIVDSGVIDRHLQASIGYHIRHLDITDDGGKFVAHNNLGICFDFQDELVESAKHHQNALRLAIKMQSLHGQSVSVGNLGLLSIKRKDFATAKTCFEQHLQLTQTLVDSSAEISAWKLVRTTVLN